MNSNFNTATGAPLASAAGAPIPVTAYTSNIGATNLSAAAGPTGAILPSGQTVNNPSALKGNMTAMVGKLTHNPEKQMAGNAMVASNKEAKALRFEEKAIQWERKGNLNKATKNREKAARYRQRALTKVSQPINTTYQENKAARSEAKAIQYEQKGNFSKAQKNRERALRIRQKYNLANNAGTTTIVTPLSTGAPFAGGLTDLNRNGIPDQFENRNQGFGGAPFAGGMTDLNRNGIPDQLEGNRMGTGFTDLNRNGIPDQFENRNQGFGGAPLVGGMTDLNRNGIPDQLENRNLNYALARDPVTGLPLNNNGTTLL